MKPGLPVRAILLAAVLAVPGRAAAGGPSEFDATLDQARKALAAGRAAEGRAFLLEALSMRPGSVEVLGELQKADGGDASAGYLWAARAAAAVVDARGRVNFPRGHPRTATEDLAPIRGLLARRIEALREAQKAAKSFEGPAEGSVQAWIRRVARHLAADAPALAAESLPAIEEAGRKCGPDPKAVTAALEALLARPREKGASGPAFRAARILRGIENQARQERKPGADAPESPSSERPLSGGAVEVLREEVNAGLPPPIPAEDLAKIPPEKGPEFLAEHGDWTRPGVALSPRGLYRVETTCGLQTLQAAVRNVERCHDRLAAWFGADPFEKRRGIVRLVPSYADMEAEGSPFWWAGGFEGGDRTVVHACFTDIVGLSALLTHELTHRFDQALYPGIPAWLAEGRAVHTETCSGAPEARALDETRIDTSRLVAAFNAGYWAEEKLRKLLAGTGDYRDNYTAGYSLWEFLNTWRGTKDLGEGPLVFAERVPGFLQACSAAGGAKEGATASFQAAFLDGSGGRPSTFAAFSKEFREFLWGLGAALPVQEPDWVAGWRSHMAGRLAAAASLGWDGADFRRPEIWDRGNWPAVRVRHAAPAAGMDQARLASALLGEEGMKDARVLAAEWALAVDEPSPDLWREAAAAHAAVGRAASVWALGRTGAVLFPDLPAAAEEATAPPKELRGLQRALASLVEGLDAETDRLLGRKSGGAAFALRAERDAWAVLAGIPARGPAGEPGVLPGRDDPDVPGCGPWVNLASANPVLSSWAPLDSPSSRRWYRPNETSLVLGGDQGSSGDEGTRWFQDVVVEAGPWLDGTYTVDTSVRVDAPYFSAMLVVGKDGADRGVEIRMEGGDHNAAVRKERTGGGIDDLSVAISDARPLEERLSRTGRAVETRGSSPVFRLTVVVAGPVIEVLVDGEPVLRHRRLTGAAVEGTIAFGLRHGTVAFLNPRVRRHRVAGPTVLCPCGEWDAPLRWTGEGALPLRALQGRRLEPPLVSPGGSLLLWYTEANFPSQAAPPAVRPTLLALWEGLGRRASGVGVRLSFPAAGKSCCGRDAAPPAAGDLGIAEEQVAVHGRQPDLARGIWERAAGPYAEDYRKGGVTPERRLVLEPQIAEEMDSPFYLWVDPGGILRLPAVKPARSDVVLEPPPLVRIFAGW